jgi:hypothetical protein
MVVSITTRAAVVAGVYRGMEVQRLTDLVVRMEVMAENHSLVEDQAPPEHLRADLVEADLVTGVIGPAAVAGVDIQEVLVAITTEVAAVEAHSTPELIR